MKEPHQSLNMKPVSVSEFYSDLKADPRDIMPSIVSGYDRETGYVSEWRTQSMNRSLFGVSDGGTHLCPSRYWLQK